MTGLNQKECVNVCVHTVWEYVQNSGKDGCDVGLIYLFMKSMLNGLSRYLCPKFFKSVSV